MNNSTTWTGSDYIEHVISKNPNGWEFTKESKQGLEHFRFEEIDPFYWESFFENTWSWALYASGIYFVTIHGIQRWLKDRPAFDLRGPLFFWNSAIGIFSIMGFIRTAPGLLKVLSQPGGFYRSICKKEEADVQVMLWALLFTLSKVVELGDTVFIVLRKRPLIFLQYYHHMATLIAAWSIAPFMEPIARWLIVLNFGVHSLMYPYFALRAVGTKIPGFIPKLITTLQLAQMIAGSTVNIISMIHYLNGNDCVRHPFSIHIVLIVATSFLVLWTNLFNDYVIKNGRDKKEKLKRT